MEYCPYGQLYEILRDGRDLPPTLLLDWGRQIAAGMNYLHNHKIIHRDLKSPNVLVAENDVIKISDFGTSREWNEKSTKMSFAGTVAWMAPEIIRNEPCSEKVDIWSFGVVLWELLTGESPYKDVDSSAIIWGVGSNSLHLPVPTTCPDGFKLLMHQCWSAKPRNRPTFRQIMMHMEIASPDVINIEQEEFFQLQLDWQDEVREQLEKIKSEGSHMPQLEEELIRRRRDELRHAQDVRDHYERKLERANNLYMELTSCMLQLEKRERELLKREQALQTYAQMCSKNRERSFLKPVIKAQQRIERMHKKVNKCVSDPGTSPDGVIQPPCVPLPVPEEPGSSKTSPNRSRSRKTRHRRNNSHGRVNEGFSATPLKSPTKDALHDELEGKKEAIKQREGSNRFTPSILKTVFSRKEWKSRQSALVDEAQVKIEMSDITKQEDVCNCDNDMVTSMCTSCTSKRSSKYAADVESNATSPVQGPSTACTPGTDEQVACTSFTTDKNTSHRLSCYDNVNGDDLTVVHSFVGGKSRKGGHVESDGLMSPLTSPKTEAEDMVNCNQSAVSPSQADLENGNSMTESNPAMGESIMRDSLDSPIMMDSLNDSRFDSLESNRMFTSIDSDRHDSFSPPSSPKLARSRSGSKRLKRQRSSLNAEQPSISAEIQDADLDDTDSEKEDVTSNKSGLPATNTWSGGEEVASDAENRLRSGSFSRTRQTSESSTSSEDAQETSRSVERPARVTTSVSTENLHKELFASCHSDGLSDKESVVCRIKHNIKANSEKTLPSVADYDTSDSEGTPQANGW